MRRRRRNLGGCLFRLVLACFLLALLAGGALFASLTVPYQGFGKDAFLDIPRGTGSAEIGKELAANGVIRYEWQFWAARLLHPGARLQAGEYRFAQPASVWTVFGRIVRGDVFYYEVTIPEGSNMFDIANTLDPLGFIPAKDFLRAASKPGLIHDLAPEAPNLEGYLFPSTYRLTGRASATQFCKQMTDEFRKHWRQLAAGETVNVNATVTLASLVEKETAVPTERPRVAGVYANRLREHVALDCDPTTIYAALLEKRYHGVIHRSDLESGNKYNTYRHAGLPPGPIANPGESALKAALHPEENNLLYFVAKGDGSGGHNFAATLTEHNRNVAMYRQAHH